MHIIIGAIIVIVIIFTVLPILLKAIGSLLIAIASIGLVLGVVAISIAFPPIGVLILIFIVAFAIFGDSGDDAKNKSQ
ncbi:hypothetical protein [Plesiomonas shigelloides]|uniref:hypothetical protein n=1 Tax=Plesiomonas shigelloides TaxID=703 RepID=UPI00387F347B